jgi:signal transduction histidine kinase
MRLGDRPRPVWLGFDTALALVVLLAAQIELWMLQDPSGPRALLVLVDVVACAALAWRRRQPLVAVAGTVASILLPFLFGVDVAGQTDPGLFYAVATLIAVHAAAAYLPLRPAVSAGCLVLVAQYLTLLVRPTHHAADYLYALVLYGAVFAAGRVQARQRDQMRLQAREANRVLLEQRERERQAKLEERRQIARELHDVIAHGIALMVVQAGAAEALLPSDPVGARSLLGAVQDTGAQAANDLRRQLGLLGDGDDGGDVKPAPRLVDVERLVAELLFSGLHVTFHAEGRVDSVEAGMGLAAYRIVQEALTNVVKHAPDAHVEVRLNVGTEEVRIVVTDDGGTGPTRQPPAQDGRGLIGMRERVELYGGELTAEALGTGFRVQVRLPLHTSQSGSSAGPVVVR